MSPAHAEPTTCQCMQFGMLLLWARPHGMLMLAFEDKAGAMRCLVAIDDMICVALCSPGRSVLACQTPISFC